MKKIISVPLLFMTLLSWGQKDSFLIRKAGFICQFTYTQQFPGADMALRYGKNNAVGSGVYFKTTGNWTFGIEGNYIFGSNIREQGIFSNLTDGEGYAVAENGGFIAVQAEQRGFNMMLKAGKIIPLGRKTANSGLFITLGAGYLEHYLRLKNQTISISALKGDYRYGYDRLCSGFAVNQFIGYQHLDKRNRLNFFAGIELYQAFTSSKRLWDYDLRSSNTAPRLDLLYGIRFGWLLPIYTHSGVASKGYTFR
jgi:hypothetical protein